MLGTWCEHYVVHVTDFYKIRTVLCHLKDFLLLGHCPYFDVLKSIRVINNKDDGLGM